jgi:hypothetical protein
MTRNLRRRYSSPRRQRMLLRDDAKELSLRQRFESYRGMLQPRAHRHHLASPKQKKVDRILDLENVKID